MLFGILASFITFPILTLLLCYMILKHIFEKPSKAFLFSADLTTIILMIHVNTLVAIIWDFSIIIWMIILFLLFTIIFIFGFWKKDEEIRMKRTFRVVWRSHFLLYFFLHIFIFLYGVIDRIFTSL